MKNQLQFFEEKKFFFGNLFFLTPLVKGKYHDKKNFFSVTKNYT